MDLDAQKLPQGRYASKIQKLITEPLYKKLLSKPSPFLALKQTNMQKTQESFPGNVVSFYNKVPRVTDFL